MKILRFGNEGCIKLGKPKNYQLERTYSASLVKLNVGFWKRKVLFFYMEINEPSEANKKYCIMNKIENLYKIELWKDTEQFHTYKFDMIGYMNNFLNNKNYQISI